MDAAELGWSDFFVAVAGAAAALAGLIIVAMSVNIRDALKAASIPSRAAAAIAALTVAVVVSCLGLVPGQPLWALGVEVLAGVVVLWVIQGFVVRDLRRDEPSSRAAWPRIVVAGAPAALFTVAGVLLVVGSPAGLALIAAACATAIIAGVLFGWVVLVEILR